MDTTLPPVPIANMHAFLDVFGQWNLHDMEVREVRFRAPGGSPAPLPPELELTLALGDHNLRPRAPGAPAVEHECVFRFSAVEGLDLRGFGAQNVIGGYEFSRDGGADALILVRLESAVGGDAGFLCAAIEVVRVSQREVSSGA